MVANKLSKPNNIEGQKSGGVVKNISQVITDMLTEPMPQDNPLPGKEPVPPELMADAVGWAPSMPPGPLLDDLSAHDPHTRKVPISEAKTIPPTNASTAFLPQETIRPPAKTRKIRPLVAIVAAAFLGAGITILTLGIVFFLFGLPF